MKILSQCEACYKTKFIVRIRRYKVSQIKGHITSQNLLCGQCARGIRKALKQNHG